MRWEEIEKSAAAYQEQNQLEAEAKQHNQPSEAALQEEALEMLEKIHARESLEAFRDGVWGEGEIIPASVGGYRGLQLISLPFFILRMIDYPKPKGTVQKQEYKSTLSILVNPPIGDIPKIDSRIALVEVDNLNSIPQNPDSLQYFINVFGLYYGLCSRHTPLKDHKDEVFLSDPQAQDRFYQALFSISRLYQDYHCLPSQIRSYTNSLIEQLPETLRQKRHGWRL